MGTEELEVLLGPAVASGLALALPRHLWPWTTHTSAAAFGEVSGAVPAFLHLCESHIQSGLHLLRAPSTSTDIKVKRPGLSCRLVQPVCQEPYALQDSYRFECGLTHS